MKNYILFLILLVFIGCDDNSKKNKSEIKDVKVNINDFPKAWSRITKINNDLINYYPCKGGDRSIQFSTLSNGDKLMYVNYDEQYFDFLVSELIKEKNGYTLKVLDRKSYVSKTFLIENYDNKNNLFYWTWNDNEKEYRFLFTPFNSNSKYPVIYQPCKECPDVPCVDKEIIKGEYKATLPYNLALDGNDYREVNFTITKDSISELEIYYYPENEIEKGESIKYSGKAKIDSIYFTIEFQNFDKELRVYFNPTKESKLEYLNDSIFRFKKTVKGLLIDDAFCENWEMKKYKN
ncbi:hypothetical protein [uncultured Maribacter sp.]|uniref:hypothetical protein n=1 Tax=uncultured Maribacter sp. TaxID=431308 RepID=UPI002602E1D9|nr:hypothetical protein [uncultured Maribacter sp.]